MNITSNLDKKEVNTSKSSAKNDHNVENLQKFAQIADEMNVVIKNFDNDLYESLQICESLSNTLDDIIKRSPWSFSSVMLNFQAQYYNGQVKYLLEEAKKRKFT